MLEFSCPGGTSALRASRVCYHVRRVTFRWDLGRAAPPATDVSTAPSVSFCTEAGGGGQLRQHSPLQHRTRGALWCAPGSNSAGGGDVPERSGKAVGGAQETSGGAGPGGELSPRSPGSAHPPPSALEMAVPASQHLHQPKLSLGRRSTSFAFQLSDASAEGLSAGISET